jgi:hypothetical protein
MAERILSHTDGRIGAIPIAWLETVGERVIQEQTTRI